MTMTLLRFFYQQLHHLAAVFVNINNGAGEAFYTSGSLIAIAIVAIAVLVKIIRRKHAASEPLRLLPPLPPAGPTFSEFLAAQKDGHLTELQTVWVAKYGPIFTIPSPLKGPFPDMVAVADPSITKELCIVQTNQYRPPSRFTTRSPAFAAATRNSVGMSLAASIGDDWKWRRAAFLKEMHKSKLFNSERQLVSTIHKIGEQLCAKLEEAAVSKKLVKVDILATEAAFDTIIFFLFGKVLHGYDANEVRQAAKDTLSYMLASLSNPLFFLFQHIPGSSACNIRKKRNAAWHVFDSLVHDEIVQMVKEAKKESPRDKDRLPGSILEAWLGSEPKFYQRGLGPILAEVRGMMLAGFETTAHALAYSFGMMAENKVLSAELHEVSKQALTENNAINAALEKSLFVRNFFMEALRLYPLAPMLGGECTDNVVLTFQDKTYGLPKGTQCLFFNYVMQRHIQYCKGVKDPDEVEPTRWDCSRKKDEPFLNTFNNGPHSCPGKPLSILEGHIFLLQVASRFYFTFPEGTDRVMFEEELLLRPKDAMPLYVTKRECTT
jgi:cytochrome P450